MFGRRPTLFRPPYGAYDDRIRRAAMTCGYKTLVMWAGSTNNGKLTMQTGALQNGDVILLHWRLDLLDNLHDLVTRCQAEGFTIGRLEDYLSPDP
jgi:peptidoglycan/xylan/chitin deacetylase (PgdA/CDA1 family)